MSRVLSFLLVFILIATASAESLNVMTYNVWVGFNKKATLDEGAAWIKAQNTDVLGLEELKGFNQKRLETAAKKWGHGYAVIFDRKGGYPQGLTSKTPIEKIEQIQPGNDPKLRGTLHCKTAGIHFFVVHFDPRNCFKRQKEVAAVTKRVKLLLAAGEKVVVMGDFNAHSRADQAMLSGQTQLLEKWCAKEKENKAYHEFDANGEVDFSVVQSLLDGGLIDPACEPMPTFPTRVNFPDTPETEYAGLLQRIDFILADSSLAKRATIQYPRDEVLNKISDHFPVVMEVK